MGHKYMSSVYSYYSKNNKKYDIASFWGLVFYRIVLDISYAVYICTVYRYIPHFQIDWAFSRYIISWAVYVFLAFLTMRRKESIVAYYLVIQFTITIAPMITMYGLSNRSITYFLLISVLHALQCILAVYFKVPKRNIIIRDGYKVSLLIVTIITLLAFLLTMIRYGIPSLSALNLYDVYEIREEHSFTGILGYIMPWFFTVVLPLAASEAWVTNHKKAFACLAIFAFYFYLTYAHKTWLFSVFYIFAIFLALRKNKFRQYICWGLPILVAVTTLMWVLDHRLSLPVSLFVRRTLILPANIEYTHFDYVSENQFLFLSEGLFGRILGMQSPYGKELKYIIGDQLGLSGMAANTGYLADAYSNFGVIGMFVYSFLLLRILQFVDSFTDRHDLLIHFTALSYCLLGLNDSSLLTRLLTGGFGVIIILLLFRKNKFQSLTLCDGIFRT